MLPFYLFIGVSEEKFWDSCPVELKPYEDAWNLRRKQENQMMYLQGLYFADALNCTICNAYRGKGKKQAEYPSEPYQIMPLTEREREQKEDDELQKLIARFNGLESDYKVKQGK